MSTIISLTNSARSAQADAVIASLSGGSIKLYAGAVPANVDAALGGATLLASCALSTPAAPAAVNGVATFGAIADDPNIAVDGTASFFRIFQSDDTTPLMQGAIGVTGSGTALELSDVALVTGGRATITSFTYTV